MFIRPTGLLASLILLLCLLGSFVYAVQAQGGEPGCDLEELLAHQQEHAAELAQATHMLEHQTDEALAILYRTGIAYQALAIQCGFERGAVVESEHSEEHGVVAEEHDEERMALAMSVGDPENGETLFNTMQAEVGFACATCHRVDSTERLIGPGLLGVGDPEHDHTVHSEDAAETDHADHDMAGEDADHEMAGMSMDEPASSTARTFEEQVEYLRTSILDPSAFVVPGYPDDLMPKTYREVFTQEEINDLIAYLLTL